MIWAIIIVIGVILDQVFKHLVTHFMDLYQSIPIIDGFFSIHYVTNTGGAWSIFSNHTWILTVISALMTVGLIFYMTRTKHTFMRLGMSMIVGGALGNMIDRIFAGAVVDYLDFIIFGYDYPVFNFADILVVCGAGVLVVYVIGFYDKVQARLNVASQPAEAAEGTETAESAQTAEDTGTAENNATPENTATPEAQPRQQEPEN